MFFSSWWKYSFRIFSIGAVLLFFWSVKDAYAAVNFGNGYYTKLCGDNVKPDGDTSGVDGPYNANGGCPARCDTGSGFCDSTGFSGNTVVKYTCDGKITNCTSGESVFSSSQNLDRNLCGKTQQIDVFDHNCRENGGWSCGIPKGFIVWYAGDCDVPPPPPPPPAQAPACDPSQVKMSVSPNPAKVGDLIIFTVSGLQGSTWIGDSWNGGVDCSGSFWGSKTCAATAAGNNFGWTHTWQNTAENNFDIKSPPCSKTVNFSVQVQPPPPPPPPPCTPNDSCSVSIPSACGQTATGVDNCRNVCSRSSAACQSQGGQSQSQSQSQTQTQTQTQTVNITNPAPVIQTFGNVGVGTSGRVLGVKELPKTGLPALIWSALALIPTGFGLRKFRSLKKALAGNPNFIWEDRQFKS